MSIVLMPHQDEWAPKFAAFKSEVATIVGECLLTLEHFGSTSIVAIAAKPIIDMIGTVRTLSCLDEALGKNLPSHIKNLAENGVPGRRYLVVLDMLGEAQAHVHLFENGHPAHIDRILFRDYLRANEASAKEYEALKMDLAVRYKDDPVSYWKGKAAFVTAILARAKGSRSNPADSR